MAEERKVFSEQEVAAVVRRAVELQEQAGQESYTPGVTSEELAHAKAALEAQLVFEADNQATLANRYGQGVAPGRSIADIDAIPNRVQDRTLDDLKKAAGAFLDDRRSVTATLTPPPAATKSTVPAATKQ